MKEEIENIKSKNELTLNQRYNCDINLCLEDILNLQDCLEKSKVLNWEPGMDFYPLTIMTIISKWEKKIGKKLNEIMENR